MGEVQKSRKGYYVIFTIVIEEKIYLQKVKKAGYKLTPHKIKAGHFCDNVVDEVISAASMIFKLEFTAEYIS